MRWEAIFWTERGWRTVTVTANSRTAAITKAAKLIGTHRDNLGDIKQAGRPK